MPENNNPNPNNSNTVNNGSGINSSSGRGNINFTNKNKDTNKKKLIYLAIAVAVVLIISVGTALILRTINDSTKQVVPTKTTANNLKTDAIEALEDDDKDKAKALFQEANQQYKELGDKNNEIDTEAQLYLIEHVK